MSSNCVWDGNSQTEQDNGDGFDFNDIWEPWKNIIVSQKTATANITKLQQLARRKQQQIKSEHIAEALEAKNFLRYTITIQIASNGNFVSIEFFKKEQMEQFCCEPLTIQGFNITFYPEGHKRKKPSKRLMNVSLINIPPETPESLVTEFLEEYADIEGTPMYVKKDYNGRKYCTGNRVYQITKLYQHIPRRLPNTFGRTIICIYDIQPEQEQYNQQKNRQRQPRNRRPTHQQTSEQPTTTDTESDENTDNQWKQQRYYRKKQNQQKRKQTNNITQRRNRYQTQQQPPDVNDKNYPQLPPQQEHQSSNTTTPNPTTPPEQENQSTQQQNVSKATTTTKPTPEEETTVIPETNPLPTSQPEEIYDSPSLVTNNHSNVLPQQTPEPNNIATPETPNNNKRNNATPKTKKQLRDEVKIYNAKKFTTQLQQTGFCDIGRLTEATEEERNNIIAASMYDRLGPYDPSNEYIINYKNMDILENYKEITKDRPTKLNNLIKLYDTIKDIEIRG